MGDYPLGVDGKGKPGGRGAGSSKTPTATAGTTSPPLFLDDLNFPTGVTPWRKGVLVTAAPDIFYAEDTDGDGKADKREVLFTGFARATSSTASTAWSTAWTTGSTAPTATAAERIKSIEDGQGRRHQRPRLPHQARHRRDRADQRASRSSADARRLGQLVRLQQQQPRHWHFVLDDRYLRRNPHLAAAGRRRATCRKCRRRRRSSRSAGRCRGSTTRTRPTTSPPPAASTFYRDDLFGPAFGGHSSSASRCTTWSTGAIWSRTAYIVHRAAGPTTSTRSSSSRRTDNWFRPTMLRTGPDGALWVADMYRHVIEHPEWIPKEWQKKLDLRPGTTWGGSTASPASGRSIEWSRGSTSWTPRGSVAALDSPNGWQRDMAHMVLLWRNDQATTDLDRAIGPACRLTPALGMQRLAVLDWSGRGA